MLLAAGRAGDHLTVGRILRRARRCGMEKDLYTAVGDSLIFFAATRGATPQGGVDLIRQMHGAIGADGLTDIFARGNSSTLWALLRSGDRDVLPVLAALRQAIGMPGMARILANPWLTGPGMTAQNFRYVVSVARAIDSDLPFKMMTEENDGTLAGLYLAMCDDPDILDIADDVLDGRFYSRMIFPADGDLKKTLPYVMAGRASRDVLQVVKQKILDRCGVEGLKGFLHAPESAPVKARPDYMNIIEFVAKDIAPLFPGGHVYLPAATGALLLAHGNGTVPRHEFWQRMGGSPQRWRAITNKPAPAGLSDLSSPWQFKPKLYTELLPYARRLAALENAPRTAETYAHRLAVMFANRQEAERYLDAAALRARPDDAGAIFTRAMNFSIPARGLWDVKHWRGLMLKHGMAMTKFIAHAPAIETYCAENNRPLPDNIADLHAVAGMVIYPEAEKAPEFARYAMMFNLPVQDFLRGLPALQNAAPERSVPAVTIDGAEIGKANYYLERLPPGDPRGLVLGHITNSCQSVGGNGEYAAIHGTADKDGAFYLWRQKTRGKITPDDRIVAQSWVWMAEDRATLVLDSFERLSEVYNHLAQPFIEQLAHDLLQAGRIAGVRLGAGGGTPAMPDLTRAFNAVAPAKPGQQHPDSQTQYVIRPVDHRMGLIPA